MAPAGAGHQPHRTDGMRTGTALLHPCHKLRSTRAAPCQGRGGPYTVHASYQCIQTQQLNRPRPGRAAGNYLLLKIGRVRRTGGPSAESGGCRPSSQRPSPIASGSGANRPRPGATPPMAMPPAAWSAAMPDTAAGMRVELRTTPPPPNVTRAPVDSDTSGSCADHPGTPRPPLGAPTPSPSIATAAPMARSTRGPAACMRLLPSSMTSHTAAALLLAPVVTRFWPLAASVSAGWLHGHRYAAIAVTGAPAICRPAATAAANDQRLPVGAPSI